MVRHLLEIRQTERADPLFQSQDPVNQPARETNSRVDRQEGKNRHSFFIISIIFVIHLTLVALDLTMK